MSYKQAQCLPVLFCVLVRTMAAFNEVPVSQEVPVGTEAVFRCQHLVSADNIRWRVNGSFVSRNPPPDITPGIITEDGNLVDLLTIVAGLEYNGTIIECVAEFDDGTPDETSEPPAILLVRATGVQEFTLSPMSKNVTLNTEAVFQCRHSMAHVIEWIINGTLHQRSSPGIILTTSDDTHTLSIAAQSEFNSTEIQCEAYFRDAQSQLSDTAIMMIQGLLSNVTNLARVNSTTISWDPPFSLDLTDVDPDIVYCVEVYNVTDCGMGELLTSDCNVTVTNYTIPYDTGSGWGDIIYEYIVTPRNNAAGSVNGAASLPLKSHSLRFTVDEPSLKPKNENVTDHITKLSFNENDLPIPSAYTLLLEPADGVNGGTRELIVANPSIDTTFLHLILRASQLDRARLWRSSILAFGCSNHILELLNEAELILSTHDIQEVDFSTLGTGGVSIDGFFIDETNASGVLVIATDRRSIFYHFIDRDSDQLNGDTKVLRLPEGEFILSVFVAKEDGLPVERAAAIPTRINVTNGGRTNPSASIYYELQSTSTGVCITCTFLESSTASDCVAVVHQRISLLNSSAGLMNIDSHKFARSGDTASGCIEGVNLEDYQVGVVGGKAVDSKPGSDAVPTKTTAIVRVVVIVVIVVLLAVVAAVLLVVLKRKWDRLRSHTPKHGSAPPNTYEPASPTNNPSVPLVNRVLSDEGNYSTVIDMTDGPPLPPHMTDGPPPPPPPQYSTLFHPGTTRPTDVDVGGQVIEAMYSTLAEASDTVNVPVAADEQGNHATDDQGNHSDIKHEEINGDWYAVVNKSKKGDKKPLVYSTLAAVDPSVKAPPTTDDPVAYSTVKHEKVENGDQQAVAGKQESRGDDSVSEAVKDSKVIYSTPEAKHPVFHMPLEDDHVEYTEDKEPKDQTVPTKSKEASPAPPSPPPPPPPPLLVRLTVDNLFPLLRPISSKWREMSECMPLTEELIDEIDTNNETDDSCLQEVLEWYMKNGNLNHEWEEIVAILKKMKEPELADKIYNLHVHPLAVFSDAMNAPQTTDEQVNHSGIEHEEINGDQYSKRRKESEGDDDTEGNKIPSTVAVEAPSVTVPSTADKPVIHCMLLHEGENGNQQAVVDKQENGGDDSAGETVKESKDTVTTLTPEDEAFFDKFKNSFMPVVERFGLKHEWENIVTVLKTVNEPDKIQDILVNQYKLQPAVVELLLRLHQYYLGSSISSESGRSDGDSGSSAPSSNSDDEGSVQLSGIDHPVVSSPVQQQTTDLEQGMAVHVMQASDGSAHVRRANAYENNPTSYLGDKQVVETDVDSVRSSDKTMCQGDDGLVPIVSCFQSDVGTSHSHDVLSDISC